jgi:hypothetical protein
MYEREIDAFVTTSQARPPVLETQFSLKVTIGKGKVVHCFYRQLSFVIVTTTSRSIVHKEFLSFQTFATCFTRYQL